MAALSVAALELAGTLSLLAIAPPSKPAQLEVTPPVTAIQLVRLQQTPFRHLSLLAQIQFLSSKFQPPSSEPRRALRSTAEAQPSETVAAGVAPVNSRA